MNIDKLNPQSNFGAGTPAKDFLNKNVSSIKTKIKYTGSNKSVIITPFLSIGGNTLRDSSWLSGANNNQKTVDLSTYSGPESIDSLVDGASEVVLYGAIESLKDFRPLIRKLRQWLELNPKSTIKYMPLSVDESDADAFYRLWGKISDVKDLFSAMGFQVKKDGVSLSISFELDHYGLFLDKMNMPKPGFKHLLVSTEHSDYRVQGGMGSYIKECCDLYGEEKSMLIVDDNHNLNRGFIKKNRWFSIQNLIGEDNFDTLKNEDDGFSFGLPLMEAIKTVCFYYDFDSIEFFEGGAYRVIQAKKSGMLPSDIKIITTCHGSVVHLFNGKGEMMNPEYSRYALREKYTTENSDVTIFPTKYLKESYEKLDIYANNPVIRRLPMNTSKQPPRNRTKKYDTFIYIGKTNVRKGFDLFLNTALALAEENTIRPSKIECFVTNTNIEDKQLIPLMDKVKKYYDVRIRSLMRAELMVTLSSLADKSLALLPYPGDNHSLVILEMMYMGIDFIAIDAGGTPELVPNNLRKNFIAPHDLNGLFQFTKQALTKLTTRSVRIQELQNKYMIEQQRINDMYKASYFSNIVVNNNISKYALSHEGAPSIVLMLAFSDTNYEIYSKNIESRIKDLLLQVIGLRIYINNEIIAKSIGINYFDNLAESEINTISYGLSNEDNIMICYNEIPSKELLLMRLAPMSYYTCFSEQSYAKLALKNYDHGELHEGIDIIEPRQPLDDFNTIELLLGSRVGGGSLYFNRSGVDNSALKKIIRGFYLSSESIHISIKQAGENLILIPVKMSMSYPTYTTDINFDYVSGVSNTYAINRFDQYLIFCKLYHNRHQDDSQVNDNQIASFLHSTFGTYDTPHISKLIKISKGMQLLGERNFRKITTSSLDIFKSYIKKVFVRAKT
jgi:glycosyltransferase involved in cell wall biosynthesis